MDNPHGRVRASDGEREEYAQILRDAMGEGRLDLETGEARLASAYGATYRDELAPLIGDLPAGARYETPQFRADKRQYQRRHTFRALSAVLVLTGIWVIVAAATGPHFFWPIIPIAFIAIGMARRGCASGRFRSHEQWREHWTAGARPRQDTHAG
jgi:hypothetical protein